MSRGLHVDRKLDKRDRVFLGGRQLSTASMHSGVFAVSMQLSLIGMRASGVAAIISATGRYVVGNATKRGTQSGWEVGRREGKNANSAGVLPIHMGCAGPKEAWQVLQAALAGKMQAAQECSAPRAGTLATGMLARMRARCRRREVRVMREYAGRPFAEAMVAQSRQGPPKNGCKSLADQRSRPRQYRDNRVSVK